MTKRNGATLTERFARALLFAHNLHTNQRRKGRSTPYIAHLLAVTSIALEHGADEDEAIAALLHDAIEDQGGATTREAIRHQFGERVTTIVDSCSDADTIPKPPWQERKEAYLTHLREASPSVRLVSASDKLHNVRSLILDYRILGEALWECFKGGKSGTLWYYRAVADILETVEGTALTEELAQAVTELEKLVEADGRPPRTDAC
ncbi:MAG: HD domain-containing protein [Chloroflexota bacterium]|nr:HD domain-containing protein [Chloroflexota bacterium]